MSGLIAIAVGIATPNIKELEGRRNVPYYDVVKVLTVCDGHTGKDIIIGKKYSDKECDEMTAEEVQKYAEGVLQTSPQLVYHPMQLAAMISFSYNLGVPTYQKSTIAVLFNKGDFVGACNFLPRYNKAGGKIWTGLVSRRAKEQALCLSTLTTKGNSSVILE